MKRRGFLAATAGLVVGLRHGKLPTTEAGIATPAAPNATWSSTSIVASGGLCAPLSLIYEMPSFPLSDRPIVDALPSFQVKR